MARVIASLPCSMASSRRSLENHCLDLVAGAGALDEAQPVPARAGARGLGGEDLDHVAVVQGALQRHEPAVDPGPDAAVADLGVHGVGEVDRGGAVRQRDDVALGGEDEDLPRPEVEAQRLEELPRVGRSPSASRGAAAARPGRPRRRPPVRPCRTGCGLLLVLPVRGDAVLGAAVHVPGADLQLDRLALGADHRGVQRLVHVELGHRDVVLEPARHRAPPRVHGTRAPHSSRGRCRPGPGCPPGRRSPRSSRPRTIIFW